MEKSAHTHKEHVYMCAGISVRLSQGPAYVCIHRGKVDGVAAGAVAFLRLQILAKGNKLIITGILSLTGRPWVLSRAEDSGLIIN